MSKPPAFVAVDLAQAYRLLNHGPVTLVTSAHQGERNIMAAAWTMPLDFDPPKVAAVIDRQTRTRELIEASGRFALNIPTRALAAQVVEVGSRSGRDGDKFAELGIETFLGQSDLPLVQGCAAWLECRILPEPAMAARYDLFLGEVTAAWADPALYSDGRWHFPNRDSQTLHYISGGAFFASGDYFEV